MYFVTGKYLQKEGRTDKFLMQRSRDPSKAFDDKSWQVLWGPVEVAEWRGDSARSASASVSVQICQRQPLALRATTLTQLSLYSDSQK